jgi:hypothetical protein
VIALRRNDQDHGCGRRNPVWPGLNVTKSNYSIWTIKIKALMRAAKMWDAMEPEDAKDVDHQKALTTIFKVSQKI